MKKFHGVESILYRRNINDSIRKNGNKRALKKTEELNRNKVGRRLKGTNASNAPKSWQNESWWYYREGVAARMHVSRFMARPSLYMQTGHAWKVCGRRHVHWTWLIAYKRHCKSRRYNVCFCHRGARAATAHRDTWRSLKRCLGWWTSFLSFSPLSFSPFNVKLSWLHSFQLNSNRIICLNFFLWWFSIWLTNIGALFLFFFFFFFFCFFFFSSSAGVAKSCHVRKRTILVLDEWLTSRIWRRFGWNYRQKITGPTSGASGNDRGRNPILIKRTVIKDDWQVESIN